VGQWFAGASNFTDVSGYSPAGTHDGYIVTNGTPGWFLTNDVPAGRTGYSFRTTGTTTGLAISNSSTLDANYTNTFDANTNAFSVTLWAKGFPGSWNPFMTKFGESESGWQLRDLGSQSVGGTWPTSYGAPAFTVRDSNAGTELLGVSAGDDMGPTNQIADGNWHFYAGSFSALTGNRYLYVDGVLRAEETNNTPCIPAAAEHVIIAGKDSPPGNSFGSFAALEIYDARIYNYDLTQPQVTAIQHIGIQPTLTSQYNAALGTYTLTWNYGALQTTTNLLSGWTTLTNASPFALTNNINLTLPQQFFRVQN
jgi:hypothetical protein